MLINNKSINMITHNEYILASTSASRKRILKNAGFPFKQVKPLCNEKKIKDSLKNKHPVMVAKRLSYEKAKSVSLNKKFNKKKIIGCDTLIYLDKKIFDKAKNIKEASTKLRALSGKKHKIVTGMTICYDGKKIWQCSSTTEVMVRKLNNKQIGVYLKKAGKQILQSVGCYQIEGLGPNIIQEIKGDFFNVMGLPLFKLIKYTSLNK